jgi:glycosyltransferase involved in cell wall biosynthesis
MDGTLIVIPAYNAGATLRKLLSEIHRRYPTLDVLVVDDGSEDNTGREAAGSGVEVLRLEQNRGKGAALRAGFAYALTADYASVITLDADLQHDPAEIAGFMSIFERTDSLVIGVRARRRPMPPARRLSNYLVSLFCSLLAGRKLIDVQCGYRLLPVPLLRTLPLTGRRYELELELAIRAARSGSAIEELPVRTIYNRHHGFINPLADTLRFLKMCWQSLFW